MDVREFDVVCIGSGGAGVSAAVAAGDAGARVLLLSKEPIGYGNTRIAGGRIATCGIVPEDNTDVFYNDLLSGGDYLNNPKLARVTADEARLSGAIGEGLGQLYRRDPEGAISRAVTTRAGGHTYHRTISDPGKGLGFGHALRAASARTNLTVLEETVAVKLLRNGERIAGLVAWNMASGEPVVVHAPAVIIASGGYGWMYYPHTDCMKSSTGDGLALAYDAGAVMVDMEQLQYIPFGCTHPASMIGIGFGEPSLAGPRGRLLDAKGREVLTGIGTMTRARTSRAIAWEIQQGNGTKHGGLLLDMSPNLERESGRIAWQKMNEQGLFDDVKRAYGVKAARWEEPWDVCPTAHFSMGGVRIDEHGRSNVPGLYAAGEAAGGIHGGDRLGSVALAEMYIFGKRAGNSAVAYGRRSGSPSFPTDEATAAVAGIEALLGAQGEHRPITLVRRLQQMMWDKVGVVRDEAGMSAALAELREIKEQANNLRVDRGPIQNQELLDAVELRLMLPVAEMAATSALCRRESRGGHLRTDYPELDDAKWLANIVLRKQGSDLALTVEPIARS